jgi:hypothetical protein
MVVGSKFRDVPTLYLILGDRLLIRGLRDFLGITTVVRSELISVQ